MPTYTIEDLHRWAKSENGRCLSKEYYGIKKLHSWICEQGHTFDLKPVFVRQGAWCPKCEHEDKEAVVLELMREFAEKSGGKCLSKSYINVHEPLKWECKKGHRFADSRHVIRLRIHFCLECRMDKKRAKIFERIKTHAKTKRGKCLFDEFINYRTELKFECAEGHRWKTSSLAILYGKSWCPHCYGNVKRTMDYMHQLAKDKGGECLSKSKTSVHKHDYLKWRCRNGHIFTLQYNSVRVGSWCTKCKRLEEQVISLELMKDWAKERGGECLSKTYINAPIPLEWKCSNGHKFKLSRGNLSQKENWCPQCSRIKYCEEQLNKIKLRAKKRGGRCISKKYIDQSTKLTFECEKGHRWKTTPHNFKHNSWCPHCRYNAGFELMKNWARKRGGKCLSSQYIDTVSPLVWECKNGHTFKMTRDHVKQKKDWCEECQADRIRKKRLAEVKKIAKSKGGRCLSNEYYNLRTKLIFECEKGHIWKTTPTSIIYVNTWCSKCAPNAKLSLKDMQKLAKEKNGKCLSKKYIGVTTRMKWQCEKGHVWLTPPCNIRSGTWCPKCAGCYIYTIEDMQNIASSKGGECLSITYVRSTSKL